jgi:hypothetical protein
MGFYYPKVHPRMSRALASRQMALRRLAHSQTRSGRRALASIRSRAVRNVDYLRRALAARAVLRRAMRRYRTTSRKRRLTEMTNMFKNLNKRRRY